MAIALVVGIVLAAIGAATDSIIPLIVGDVLLVIGIGLYLVGRPAHRPGGRLTPKFVPCGQDLLIAEVRAPRK